MSCTKLLPSIGIRLFYSFLLFFSPQRENKEPASLKIFGTSPKMVGLEIVSAGKLFKIFFF